MDTGSRKGVAAVAAQRTAQEAPAPVSPETFLEVDETCGGGRRVYKGRFKYKVPTMGDRVDIASLKAQYLQQLKGVDLLGENVAEALAYLHATIDHETAPQWWKDTKRGIDLYDFQPLMKLYAAARAYEATFLDGDPVAGADEGAPEDGPADDADGGLGGDVQPAPQRRQVLASFGEGSR